MRILISKSGDASQPKNYRPIALTSMISTCLERLLVKLFQPLITDPLQFAYRPGRSTEDALLLTIDLVSDNLDKNSKNSVKSFGKSIFVYLVLKLSI